MLLLAAEMLSIAVCLRSDRSELGPIHTINELIFGELECAARASMAA